MVQIQVLEKNYYVSKEGNFKVEKYIEAGQTVEDYDKIYLIENVRARGINVGRSKEYTNTTISHWEKAVDIADEAKVDPNVKAVYVDETLKNISDKFKDSDARPDVTIEYKDGTFKLIEVQSKTDYRPKLENKLKNLQTKYGKDVITIYIRGKFKGNNKEMKKAYFCAKEMMTKYDLKPQYIGVIGEKGWTGDKLLTIKRKEKQLLEDLEKDIIIKNIGLETKEMEGKEIINDKSFFLIEKEGGTIAFWTNTNIEEVNFEEILEEMKKYVEPGIEEICDWESGSSPIVYVLRGEKTLEKTGKFQDKITIIYKKVTPLDIPIEV